MDPDDRVRLLDELPASLAKELLSRSFTLRNAA
jgi:Mg/Co/Ni transporter MgtE